MQGIMLKILFTEFMRTIYNNYEIKPIGELYQITNEVDQPIAAIQVLANVNHFESIIIEEE